MKTMPFNIFQNNNHNNHMVVDNVFFNIINRFDSITFIYTINYLSLNACAYFYHLLFLRAVFLQLRSQRDWSEKTKTSSLTLISCEYWDYFLSDLDRRNAIYGTFFMDFCEINNLQQFGIYVHIRQLMLKCLLLLFLFLLLLWRFEWND